MNTFAAPASEFPRNEQFRTDLSNEPASRGFVHFALVTWERSCDRVEVQNGERRSRKTRGIHIPRSPNFTLPAIGIELAFDLGKARFQLFTPQFRVEQLRHIEQFARLLMLAELAASGDDAESREQPLGRSLFRR